MVMMVMMVMMMIVMMMIDCGSNAVCRDTPDRTSVTAWWDSYELEVSVLVSR